MKLNYKVFGEGQPMIILHGLLGSLDNWQTLARRFSSDFKVYTVDQRNHGQSPHSDDMDYDLMVDDLTELISDLNIENPILIGHSMGGNTVMKYALENPDRIHSLISVDIAPRAYSVRHNSIMDALKSIDFNTIQSRKEVEQILMEKINDLGIVQFLSKNVYWKEKNKLAYRFNLDALNYNLDLISNWSRITSQFEGKTLFIRGGKADYITDDEPTIPAYFPNYELVTLDTGHWVHAEKPEEFYKTVIDFLK